MTASGFTAPVATATSHYETVTLVEHGSGILKISCSIHNANEELDVIRQLLSETGIAGRADAVQLLQWDRGNWTVENVNHHVRDRTFQKDACLRRTANGPSNRAKCNNIALALKSTYIRVASSQYRKLCAIST